MATLNINLDKLITEKLEAKIEELVSKAVDKAFANINITYGIDEQTEEPEECDKAYVGNDEDDWPEKKLVCDDCEKKSYAGENEVGWVTKNNLYDEVEKRMKSALNEYELNSLKEPKVVRRDEYLFNNYINTLTWDDIKKLFKNNKYLNVDYDLEGFNIKQLEVYGETPTNVYYKLMHELIIRIIEEIYKSEDYTNLDDNIIKRLVINDLFVDFDAKCKDFALNILTDHHKEIFDDIFGEDVYLNCERNQNIFRIHKPNITNKEINNCIWNNNQQD